MSVEKQIVIQQHNPEWKEIFMAEQEKIKKLLGENCINIYHVGSTAVPGLIAKPRIDIIVEVQSPKKTIDLLKELEYEYKGEYNIPFKFGFAKRGPIEFNLQVYPENHPEVELNLTFRDWIKTHPEELNAYGKLKEELLADPNNHQKQNALFPLYSLKKGLFIHEVLQRAGYARARMVAPSTESEWQEFHALLKENNLSYKEHPSLHPLIFYSGVIIIGAACLGISTDEVDGKVDIVATLICFYFKKSYFKLPENKDRESTFKIFFLHIIEAWSSLAHGAHVLLIPNQGNEKDLLFLEQLNYLLDDEDDPFLSKFLPKDTGVIFKITK